MRAGYETASDTSDTLDLLYDLSASCLALCNDVSL